MYYTSNVRIFFHMFFKIFLIFNYWNFDIGMFVLRSSVSVKESKKLFTITNKQRVQIGIARREVEKKKNSKTNKHGGTQE